MSRKLTLEEFIEKASKVHGTTYDYRDVIYKSYIEKIKIRCKKHGVFEQTPANHLTRSGCPKCAGLLKLTTEEFIEKAIKVHGTTYDYSDVVYKNANTKIKIRCKKHGVFEQTANSHIRGSGCPKCACVVKLTTYEFIEKASKVHGTTYDYSEVVYKNANTKIKIRCKKHGVFEQTPANHLNGSGCQKCAYLKYNPLHKDADKLYLWQVHGTNIYKVGITKHSLSLRMDSVCNKLNIQGVPILEIELQQAYKAEATILTAWSDYRYSDETIQGTEFLKLTNEELETLIQTFKAFEANGLPVEWTD